MTDADQALARTRARLDELKQRRIEHPEWNGFHFQTEAIDDLDVVLERLAALEVERARVEDVIATIGGRAIAADKNYDETRSIALWGAHGLLCDALGIKRDEEETEP